MFTVIHVSLVLQMQHLSSLARVHKPLVLRSIYLGVWILVPVQIYLLTFNKVCFYQSFFISKIEIIYKEVRSIFAIVDRKLRTQNKPDAMKSVFLQYTLAFLLDHIGRVRKKLLEIVLPEQNYKFRQVSEAVCNH